MLLFNARDLVNYTEDQIWGLSDGYITVVFDDGELRTTVRETIFSWYCWWPHREWPSTPLLVEHHMGTRRLSGDTHLRLMDSAAWMAYAAYNDAQGQPTIDPEYIALKIKQNCQVLYAHHFLYSINRKHFLRYFE